MTDIEKTLEEMRKSIEEIKAVVVAPSYVTYSVKDVCRILGISRYRLKYLYENGLIPNAPAPRRIDGRFPQYSMEDISYIKSVLINAGFKNNV